MLGGGEVVSIGWIDTEEAQRLTGYGRGYLWRLARAGKVRAQKLAGRVWYYDRASLEEWRATARPGPKPQPQEAER